MKNRPLGKKKAKTQPKRTPMAMAIVIFDLHAHCELSLINGPSLRTAKALLYHLLSSAFTAHIHIYLCVYIYS